MKFIYINFLLFFNLLISANTIESLNEFFKNNLKFVQTSFNSINNSFDKSYGNFSRDLNNNIKIEINSPFKEIYFINENGIEIHDLEFNQKKFIKNQDIPNNILKFIKNGFNDESLHIEQVDDNKFEITEFEKNYYFEFLSNDTLQIKYKDNMNIDNLINFSKQNDK
ncbi:MAG: hypothetical protein EVA93_03340 [SAR86 cluster bacterium]|uniref:Outer membrane lipoprotein carrier protein LolA n=1 Tax=SAR86 cluster bacterium TaxID=2030880 RepID=A0A520N0Y3_9GAMM|nr:MAG: hypothetical protein EVA93_03340 [SAR86 cluster bacterium]